MFKKIKKFIQSEEGESQKRAEKFVQSLSIDTLEEALVNGKYLPVTFELEGKIRNTDQYDVAESMYLLQIKEENLVISSTSKKETKEIVIPMDTGHISLEIIKSTVISYAVANKVYTMLVISRDGNNFHFVWSGTIGLRDLESALNARKIEYAIPDYYSSFDFSDKDIDRQLFADERISSVAHNLILFPK